MALAVLTPFVGVPSETFICRHIRDLLPGQTSVLTDHGYLQQANWKTDCPTLVLHRAAGHFDGPVVRQIETFLREHQVRVVLGEYLDRTLPWLDLLQKLGLPVFAHAHGYDVSMMLRNHAVRQAYGRYNEAAGVITMTHFSKKRLCCIGLQAGKMHVVPYGVEMADCPSPQNRDQTVRCLAVGRMVPKKAPILMLAAFACAAKVCPQLRLDYIGGGTLFSAARDFVHATGLADRITLHGIQPNSVVLQYMQNADMFVQHSQTDPDTGDEEGLPVAILEAMAHGLPVVSTTHAGIPEAVVEGETGYLVAERDFAQMANRIVALATDHARRDEFARAAWRRAQLFSWQRERELLLRVLGLQAA